MSESEFFTIRGYNMHQQREISYAMEDYLEMIYRHTREEKFIRIKQLAALLNVKPSSASKMAAKLRESGLTAYEPYGIIQLTPRGEEVGGFLLNRHNVLHQLFCLINRSKNETELVEKIEHSFDAQTIGNISLFLQALKNLE